MSWVAGVALAAALAGGPGGARRRAPDPWFGPDKVKHFFMAGFIQSVTYGLARATNQTHQSSIVCASAVSLAFAVGKEWRDRHTQGDFSARDLAWDAAGAGVASLALRRTR